MSVFFFSYGEHEVEDWLQYSMLFYFSLHGKLVASCTKVLS